MTSQLHAREGGPHVGPGPTDAELLARWSGGGDPEALEQIVRRHGGLVYGVCRRVLGRGPDLDDAFQATFLVLVRKGGSLAQPERVAGWLHGVAVRIARKAKADRDRRFEREATMGDPPAPDTPEDTRELRQALDEELDLLPEHYRLPIVLCELEGLTLEEAARRLGWPKGTVAGRLSRGRDRLRRRLSRRSLALPLFLGGPPVHPDRSAPPDPLVSATVATAAGRPGVDSRPAALADSVLPGPDRRRLNLILPLVVVGFVAGLAWGAQTVSARHRSRLPDRSGPGSPGSEPSAPAPGGCHSSP